VSALLGFRPYAPEDLDTCVAIFRSNIPTFFLEHEVEELRSYLQKYAIGSYWCAELAGEVVACGGYSVRADGCARLCYGMVRGELHRRGYGRQLAEFRIREILKNPTVTSIGLDTSQHNPEFFRKFGFEPVSVEKNKYGPGLDSHEMILRVGARG
jgi:ribosomal protein S18 acetylase RimI-like enzyme